MFSINRITYYLFKIPNVQN